MPVKTTTEKYGCKWTNDNPLEIELYAIRHGGHWKQRGKTCGEGLLTHYLNARALIWPERYRHRWTDLIYKEAIEHKIVIYVGPASAQKTSHISEIGLISYWADPENTAVLVSTMSVEKLDAAILGEIKMLWRQGKARFPWLPGHVIDHKHCIVTDDIKETGIRDMRRGIFGKACYIGERYVGLGVYAGIKQKNFWFLCDELSYMPATFMDCLPNMFSNTRGGGLHVLGSGNPNHDFESQLAQAAEPPDGWASVENNETTSVWPIKLPDGVCVNLIGPDGPNFDFPSDEPTHFPGLIDQQFEQTIAKAYGKYSPKYETQVMGRMKVGLATMRVITRQLCKQHHAHDKATWEGTKRTRIYAVDPAYGGGDDCIGGWGEFGLDDKGKTIFRIEPPKIIRIDMRLGTQPEDQIAEYVKTDLRLLNIPPDQAFYDSFGKGTVGFAFSKVFGHQCPIPINAGERPTTRPVRSDLYVTDDVTGEKRLERCDEHYSKFITEMWFSVHYAIKAEQIRELPEDVMVEGCWREYYDVAGGKIEVESKPDMKKRTGKSPNKFDWCFTGETMVHTPSGEVRIDRLMVADSVSTPFGVSKIGRISKRLVDVITEAQFSNGKTLQGAGEHKIFVWGSGWKRLDSLTISMENESICNLPIWTLLNELFTKDDRTSFKTQVDIIAMAGIMRLRDFYTELSGVSTTALFLKVCASITKTAIGWITPSVIWNYLKRKSIPAFTCNLIGRIQRHVKNSWLAFRSALLLRLYGMELKMANSGTAGMPSVSGDFTERKCHASVSSAEQYFCPILHQSRFTSVPTDVRIKGRGEKFRLLKEFAVCAVKNLWRSGCILRSIAPVVVRQLPLHESKPVYNLTLESHNVYYANGILVSNCAILLEGARRHGFVIGGLGDEQTSENPEDDWFDTEQEKYDNIIKSKLLIHA